MALRREWIGSPNYSSRGGTRVRLIVVHTAEGALDYQSLGAFFANPASGVSSHTGIDDTPGVIGEYVKPGDKAWTQGNANPYAVAAELCAFAAWTPAEWDAHPQMLANVAAWIAEEAARFGIPIRKLTADEAQGTYAGVCGHVDLGVSGGNHWDPGPSFPWERVLQMAQGGSPPEEVFTLSSLVQYVDANGVQTYAGIGKDGHLYEYKHDGHHPNTPANKENKTWSAYDLTATSAGSAEGKPFAT
jgi:hypothetical protein